MQRIRLDAYYANAPLLRVFYALTYDNVRHIIGSSTMWAMYDYALKQVSGCITQRLEYYRRTSQGLAARVHGLCRPPADLLANSSEWLQFCPVSLTLGNELVLCQDPSFTVEYQHNIYWMISEAYMKLFIDDPESFLTLTLPEERPLLLNATERKTSLTPQLEGRRAHSWMCAHMPSVCRACFHSSVQAFITILFSFGSAAPPSLSARMHVPAFQLHVGLVVAFVVGYTPTALSSIPPPILTDTIAHFAEFDQSCRIT